MWGEGVDICFGGSPNDCSRSLIAERQNIFDLIAQDNHPTNFGCIKPIFHLANLFARTQKSRNASYLFAANFFASQF